MKAEYINPFISSADSVFKTMVNLALRRLQARAGAGNVERKGETLTAVVGISGAATGVVALSFPREVGLKVAGRFLGTEVAEMSEAVTDALAELANMVAGGAKSKFELDPPPDLSMPTVVEGADYRMKYPTKSVWVEVPFTSEVGEFVMEVSFSTN